MFGVNLPVAVVFIFSEIFVMGTFLALGFSIFALFVPFEVAVAIFLDTSDVVLLLVTAVVSSF